MAERLAREYFGKYDADGDASIDLAEFRKWTSSARTEDEMRERFRSGDKDGDGLISEAELRLDYAKIGAHEIADFADAMLKVADANGDGVIQWQEYLFCAKELDQVLRERTVAT